METDILIVGTGAAGLFCALHLPREYRVLLLSKDALDRSDSYLAQGGICMLPEEADFDAFFEDTMRAGHYENNPDAVRTMIRSSREVISDLLTCGVAFEQAEGELRFTREGGHSRPRILFHEDVTGREITSKLLAAVKKLPNVTLLSYTTMVDLLVEKGRCRGVVARDGTGRLFSIAAGRTVLACGGIGGLYTHSTNYRHLTGDGLAVCLRHGVPLEHPDYVQIHPTTLYSERPGRRFLISESVRGEGAVLLDKNGERFADELLPRDRLTAAIRAQMEKEGSRFVRLSLLPLGREKILSHFPHIYSHCMEEGFDVTREPIPVVPAQHYFMGGIKVDLMGRTGLAGLYAVGETSCTGVHGANRLASNSLLECLVFAKRAARDITADAGAHTIGTFTAEEIMAEKSATGEAAAPESRPVGGMAAQGAAVSGAVTGKNTTEEAAVSESPTGRSVTRETAPGEFVTQTAAGKAVTGEIMPGAPSVGARSTGEHPAEALLGDGALPEVEFSRYADEKTLAAEYKKLILSEIERGKTHESDYAALTR